MTESKGVWIAKTIALCALASAVVTVVAFFIQTWLTGNRNGAVAGGAGATTAAIVAMQRRSKFPGDQHSKT